ncbi:hypothetical protein TrCOL_g7082 [Triparma columacea]|uniref:Uncharacterized protein n=1 Tax=Triparma columacea TaxID=722753 RepID=A0A9W7GI94_9STRA|nr:hypothetical protein TrCOL_g7082 [Triparma columacea]
MRSVLYAPLTTHLRSLRKLAASTHEAPPPFSSSLSSSYTLPPAIVLFTSGTTGKPKGVKLSLRSVLFQSFAKTCPPTSYAADTALYLNIPLCHVGGLISMLGIVLSSGSLILPPASTPTIPSPPPLPSPATNALAIVPSMLNQFPPQTPSNQNITLLLVGGSSLNPKSTAVAVSLFPNARIVQTYACTEAASSITFLPLPAPSNSPPNSIGNSYSRHIEVGIFSPTGSPLPNGEMGVIGTRGPHVMDGYVGCQPHLPSDFLLTSDLGYFHAPSSTFCFVGRASDTVRSGGETVVCAEVEREVIRCALDLGVRECASFGLEDPNTARGEVVCIAVVPSAGKLRLSDLKSVLKSRWGLAGYKRPRRFYQLDELPRNSSGKVVKDALRLKFGGRSRL